jgi:hypothetical protein
VLVLGRKEQLSILAAKSTAAAAPTNNAVDHHSAIAAFSGDRPAGPV